MSRPTASTDSVPAAGSLTVVGTGILAAGHLTLQAKSAIEKAERVFYAVVDPVTESFLLSLDPSAESLGPLYLEGRDRAAIYGEMARRILEPVRQGKRVCAAFYGHPGVCAASGHLAIETARAEGYPARMLAAVSAEDCLVADLGLDPLARGLQSFEATRFLVTRRRPDPTVPLVLWQIGAIGMAAVGRGELWQRENLEVLAEALAETYPAQHEVVLYEASSLIVRPPRQDALPLEDLPRARVTTLSTLVVPPPYVAEEDPAMLERLGISGIPGSDP